VSNKVPNERLELVIDHLCLSELENPTLEYYANAADQLFSSDKKRRKTMAGADRDKLKDLFKKKEDASDKGSSNEESTQPK